MVDAQYAAWGATGLVNYLDTLSAAQLPAVLGSLSGEQHTHGQSMARRLGTQFNSLLLSRLDDADGERSHGWNFWLKGLGGFGGLDSDGNAGRADNHSGGFALGADTEARRPCDAGRGRQLCAQRCRCGDRHSGHGQLSAVLLWQMAA